MVLVLHIEHMGDIRLSCKKGVYVQKKKKRRKKNYMAQDIFMYLVAAIQNGGIYRISYISLKCDDCAFHCILYGYIFYL